MTSVQTTSLLLILHATPKSSREALLNRKLNNIGMAAENIPTAKAEVMALFDDGIGKLNPQQLNNIIDDWSRNHTSERVVDKLNYYGITEAAQHAILDYLEGYMVLSASLPVADMDTNFEGLQVATRDSFNKLLTDGYSGFWIINPDNVKPLRLQIASMNDNGPHPRGWYIQADISKFEEVEYEGQKRYVIHFTNAIAIDSGYRNIKFNQQPVTYIKRRR